MSNYKLYNTLNPEEKKNIDQSENKNEDYFNINEAQTC